MIYNVESFAQIITTPVNRPLSIASSRHAYVILIRMVSKE